MRSRTLTGFALISVLVMSSTAADANPLSVLYDACTGLEEEFDAKRQAALSDLEQNVREVESLAAPPGYQETWLALQRVEQRAFFDQEIAPTLVGLEASADDAYAIWFGEMMADLDEAHRTRLIEERYRDEKKLKLAKAHTDRENALAEEFEARQAECQSDFRNSTVRFVSRAATAPFRWLGWASD